MSSSLHYFPVAWPILLLLAALLGVVAAVAIGTLRFASASMGVAPGTILVLLLMALLGSSINVPIAYLPEQDVSSATVISLYGIPYYVVPPMLGEGGQGTVVALNVGGAVIPTLLSLYLIVKNRLYGTGLVAVAIVAGVCHLLARPVYGLGIAEPVFAPPLITAAVSIILSRRHAGPLAYISGSMGTLIGADLMNLDKIQGLGAPLASIGGAGTFDGIFLTGLIAVLYAGFVAPRETEDSSARMARH